MTIRDYLKSKMTRDLYNRVFSDNFCYFIHIPTTLDKELFVEIEFHEKSDIKDRITYKINIELEMKNLTCSKEWTETKIEGISCQEN